MQLTFREIETAFEIEEKTLYHWIDSRQMPAVKANGQYYFNSVEVLEWALKNHIPLTGGALAFCRKGVDSGRLIVPCLRRGGVYFDIGGVDAPGALGRALEVLPLPQDIDKAALKDMLLSREQLGATGVGGGIALPHVKHPVVLAGLEPVVGLFFLQNPVDFFAYDNIKVDTLFMILSASFKTHLTILSRLAFCLQQDHIRQALKQRVDINQIMAAFETAEAKAHGGLA